MLEGASVRHHCRFVDEDAQGNDVGISYCGLALPFADLGDDRPMCGRCQKLLALEVRRMSMGQSPG